MAGCLRERPVGSRSGAGSRSASPTRSDAPDLDDGVLLAAVPPAEKERQYDDHDAADGHRRHELLLGVGDRVGGTGLQPSELRLEVGFGDLVRRSAHRGSSRRSRPVLPMRLMARPMPATHATRAMRYGTNDHVPWNAPTWRLCTKRKIASTPNRQPSAMNTAP